MQEVEKLAIHWNENLSIGMPDTFEFKKDIRKSLEYLDVKNCNLTLQTFIKICKLENLKILDISNNTSIWLIQVDQELLDAINIKIHF
jgi:hypothetical protein